MIKSHSGVMKVITATVWHTSLVCDRHNAEGTPALGLAELAGLAAPAAMSAALSYAVVLTQLPLVNLDSGNCLLHRRLVQGQYSTIKLLVSHNSAAAAK